MQPKTRPNLFPSLSRRHMLAAIPIGGYSLSRIARGWQPPEVTDPRATDGDSVHEPDWKSKLTITVGTRDGDIVGNSDRPIQAALDYVARLGGGTVQVLPGLYTLRSPIFIPSGIRLKGSGSETILTKIPSETVELSQDSDWYDQEVTLGKGGSFQVGDSVVFRAKNPHDGGPTVIKRRLIAQDGRRFKLDDGLRENLWLAGKPTCSSLFPLLTSERTSDVIIENLVLDGNRANNENFNGNYGGGIFLQDCNRFHMRQVESRNYHGDGISFQICHDVLVEDCHCHDNHDLGVHPGSGSQRPILRRNRLENNSQGIFWCWGVKYGLAEENTIIGNRLYGISIGHNDTDNVMRRNRILNSGQIGILFRDEAGGQDFWPNRNRLEFNQIENSGGDEGIAIDVQGKTRDIHLESNTLVETRSPAKRIGIRIGKETGDVQMVGNETRGFSQALVDLRQT